MIFVSKYTKKASGAGQSSKETAHIVIWGIGLLFTWDVPRFDVSEKEELGTADVAVEQRFHTRRSGGRRMLWVGTRGRTVHAFMLTTKPSVC